MHTDEPPLAPRSAHSWDHSWGLSLSRCPTGSKSQQLSKSRGCRSPRLPQVTLREHTALVSSVSRLLGELSSFSSHFPLIFTQFLSLCSLSLLSWRFRAPAGASSPAIAPSGLAQLFAASFLVPSESRGSSGMPWKSPRGTSVPVLVPQDTSVPCSSAAAE